VSVAAGASDGESLLSIDVEQVDGVATVHVTGELDVASKGELRRTLTELALGVVPIVVDLSELDFIDSAGLGTLVNAHKRVRLLQGALVAVCPPQSRASDLMRVTGLNRVFRVFDTVEQAVAAVRDGRPERS